MLAVIEYLVLVKVAHDVAVDDVFQHLKAKQSYTLVFNLQKCAPIHHQLRTSNVASLQGRNALTGQFAHKVTGRMGEIHGDEMSCR